MKILMVAPEVVPFSKVGGLADVAGSLPLQLKKMGHDVRIICPKFGFQETGTDWVAHENPLHIYLGREVRFGKVWETRLDDAQTPVYLIEHDEYFDVPTVYSDDYREYEREGYRFALFSRASLDLCNYLDWIPDVIHCHDWTTGLIPSHLNTRDSGTPLGNAATVLTIHNLQFQGIFGSDVLPYSGLPMSLFKADGLESYGRVNYMKGAIYHSQKVTTVSPSYALEIQTPEFGFGLHNTLKFKASDLIGIVNGVDLSQWDPRTDKHIPAPFSKDDLSGKKVAKLEVQKQFGLEQGESTPLFVLVSRMYSQKGLDVLLHTIPRILDNMYVQFAIIGSGDSQLESGFTQMANRYPGKVGVYIGYNNPLAHLTYAGGDFLLMPSRFEPCGLSQMYSMAYGTLPIVRATGGLIDTVENYEEASGRGDGFKFEHLNTDALYYTVGWACSTYYDRKDDILKLQQNAMAKDFSWNTPAKEYEDVYRWAIETRTGKSV
jgi:starch synthase